MKMKANWIGIGIGIAVAAIFPAAVFAGTFQVQCANSQFTVVVNANDDETCQLAQTLTVNGEEQEVEAIALSANQEAISNQLLNAGDVANLEIAFSCSGEIAGDTTITSEAPTSQGCASVSAVALGGSGGVAAEEVLEEEVIEEEVIEEEVIEEEVIEEEEEVVIEDDSVVTSDVQQIVLPEACEVATLNLQACLEGLSQIISDNLANTIESLTLSE